MAIRTLSNGNLEFDTPEEALAYFSAKERWDQEASKRAMQRSHTVALESVTRSVDENALWSRLIRNIGPTGLEILRAIKKSDPSGITKEGLCKAADLNNNKALGGALGAITKHASTIGIDTDQIYRKRSDERYVPGPWLLAREVPSNLK